MELEETVEPIEAPKDADISSIAALANEQLRLEAEVARIENYLKETKKKLSQVRDEHLPGLMTDLGIRDFTLDTGYKIEVREHYRCAQLDDSPDDEKKRPLAERLAAMDWLDERQHGDICKRLITVTLGADSVEVANEIIALLRSHRLGNQLQIDHRRTVHWNTLAAFAREQLSQNEDIDLDVLGVNVQRSAKIIRQGRK